MFYVESTGLDASSEAIKETYVGRQSSCYLVQGLLLFMPSTSTFIMILDHLVDYHPSTVRPPLFIINQPSQGCNRRFLVADI